MRQVAASSCWPSEASSPPGGLTLEGLRALAGLDLAHQVVWGAWRRRRRFLQLDTAADGLQEVRAACNERMPIHKPPTGPVPCIALACQA